MHDEINTLASKERDRQSLAALMASHIGAGLAVTELPSYTPQAPAAAPQQDRPGDCP